MRFVIAGDFHSFYFQIHYMKPKSSLGSFDRILKCCYTSFGLGQFNKNPLKCYFMKYLQKNSKG